MSLFRKLFIAGAIVGTGFGVALLLGQPVAIRKGGDLIPNGSLSSLSPPSTTERPHATIPSPGSMQLVPETDISREPRLLDTSATARHDSDLPSLAIVAPALSCGGAPGGLQDTAPSNFGDRHPSPSARLRQESPRPTGNEPRSPVTIRRLPTGEAIIPNQATPTDRPYQERLESLAPAAMQAGYSTIDPPTLATPAGFDAPAVSFSGTLTSPPQFQAPLGRDRARQHVVVDGDSLERLANRYLGDPRRGSEIYELNRDALSNPELLPIGVELVIPERGSSWQRPSSDE